MELWLRDDGITDQIRSEGLTDIGGTVHKTNKTSASRMENCTMLTG